MKTSSCRAAPRSVGERKRRRIWLRAKVRAREPIWRRIRKEAARALLLEDEEEEEAEVGLGEDMMGVGRIMLPSFERERRR
jgi:hypothetical protein